MSVETITGSPFDAIRRTREDGAEYWSARELMEAMKYDQWRNFETAIMKARVAAANQGHEAEHHIAGASKMVSVGSGATRAVDDWHLTRFGAYLVMMNGDPRKPEIAAAQAYFAVKTREAEVRQQHALPTTFAEALRLAAEQAEAIEAQAAKIEADAPLVAQAQTFRQAEGLRTVGDLANDLKVWAAANLPGVKVLHQDVRDIAGHVGLIIRGDTVRNNQPTARAIEAGWVKPHEAVYDTDTRGRQVAVSTRLTPRGYARLWDACIAHYSRKQVAA